MPISAVHLNSCHLSIAQLPATTTLVGIFPLCLLEPKATMSLKVSDAVVESVSGSVGSVLALLATYPLKTIYTVQALSTNQSGSHAAALSTLDIIRKYKLSGLFVGIEPNIFESAVSSGVYFYLYSKLRHFVVTNNKRLSPNPGSNGGQDTKNRDIGVLASLLVAAVAGAGNQLVTMPASVVATRMQVYF